MRRMFSEKQIEKMIEEGSLSPEQVQEMLVGKYVRIMDAPESTTLTDEQIAIISEGVFINGDFLGFKNPVLLPTNDSGTDYVGVLIGPHTLYGNHSIGIYKINKSTKVISQPGAGAVITITGSGNLQLKSLVNINNKAFSWPSDTGTYIPKIINGVLTWVSEE